VGFRLHPDGYVTLDPAHVFSKIPAWPSFTIEESRRCFDSIPTLVSAAIRKGYLVEEDFDTAGLWQTAEEKDVEEKTPRDSLPLYRQRAMILTTEGSRKRIEAREKEIEIQKQKVEEKKEKEKEKEMKKKRIKLAWDSLRCDSETGLVVKSKRKWKEDTQCRHCLQWWGAWQEAGMEDEEFQWLQCVGCEQWWCPKCIFDGLLKTHEPQCASENDPRRARVAQQRKKRKLQHQT
jgi:hypothetical protein